MQKYKSLPIKKNAFKIDSDSDSEEEKESLHLPADVQIADVQIADVEIADVEITVEFDSFVKVGKKKAKRAPKSISTSTDLQKPLEESSKSLALVSDIIPEITLDNNGCETPALIDPLALDNNGCKTPVAIDALALDNNGCKTPVAIDALALDNNGCETPVAIDALALDNNGCETPVAIDALALDNNGCETPALIDKSIDALALDKASVPAKSSTEVPKTITYVLVTSINKALDEIIKNTSEDQELGMYEIPFPSAQVFEGYSGCDTFDCYAALCNPKVLIFIHKFIKNNHSDVNEKYRFNFISTPSHFEVHFQVKTASSKVSTDTTAVATDMDKYTFPTPDEMKCALDSAVPHESGLIPSVVIKVRCSFYEAKQKCMELYGKKCVLVNNGQCKDPTLVRIRIFAYDKPRVARPARSARGQRK